MDREPIYSSNIRSIGYKPVQKKLEIEFHSGEVYRYQGVPRTAYKSLMSSQSKGKYFNTNIKYKFPYRKYETADGEQVKSRWQKLQKKSFDELFFEQMEK